MRIGVLLLLLASLLLLGCGGQSGPTDNEKQLTAQLVAASGDLARMNASLSQCTAERDALQATISQLQQEKSGLLAQVNALQQNSQSTGAAASNQSEKLAFVEGKLGEVDEKLGLYKAYDEAFMQSGTPSNSQLVDIGIRVRNLNNTQIQNNWNSLLDCGYCANATSLKISFYTSILDSVRGDVSAANDKLAG